MAKKFLKQNELLEGTSWTTLKSLAGKEGACQLFNTAIFM